MKKFECNGCTEHCVIYRADGGTPTRCVDCDDWADWHEVKKEITIKSNQLPKLTIDVFDRPDCPEWANYAVISSNGRLSFFADKPKFEGEDYGCWSCEGYGYTHITNTFFDASDWENSLIKRPPKEELPDWCKVGAICYDYGAAHYFEVTGIDDEKSEVSISWYPKGLVEVISYSLFTEYARPARKRQFNEHEMLDLAGKVLSAPSGEWRSLILWASANEVITHYGEYNANTLMDKGYTIDGKPCVIYEHLEDGAWIQ